MGNSQQYDHLDDSEKKSGDKPQIQCINILKNLIMNLFKRFSILLPWSGHKLCVEVDQCTAICYFWPCKRLQTVFLKRKFNV